MKQKYNSITKITTILNQNLENYIVDVINDSAKHQNHPAMIKNNSLEDHPSHIIIKVDRNILNKYSRIQVQRKINLALKNYLKKNTSTP